MRIGLTYDLRSWYLERGYTMDETAEFDKEETVAALEATLARLGYETERIGNIFQLVEKLAAGDRWDMVFNIAEGLYGDGRESAVPALLDQYRIPYVFSGPVVMGVSLNKYLARLVVEAAGVPVCPGIIASSVTDIEQASSLAFPLFVKPVAEGTGKGITTRSVVRDQESLVTLVTELLATYHQPVLIEEYLPGREFTVGVTGSGAEARVTGGMEVICRDNLPYSVEVKENYENYVRYTVYDEDIRNECDAVALGAWRALSAVDAGRVDMKADRNGRMCFIEANPLAGLNPIHSDLPMLSRLNGMSFDTLMGKDNGLRKKTLRTDMMIKRCLIIYNEPAPEALPDELDVLDQVNFIESALKALGYNVNRMGITDDFMNEIAHIADEGFEFIFNLVESVGNNAEILYFIPALLNMHHLPYTGCPVEATFVTASKVLARRFMKANGIPVAGGYKVSEASGLVPGRKYILKPVWEDGSLGITEESVFTFNGTVPEILDDKNDNHWFIEDFIDGREFNVSVKAGPDGPEILPPAEMLFIDYPDDVPRIVSYKAKWVQDTFQFDNSCRRFPNDLSDRLMQNIKDAVIACWHTFGLKGYARVDMRTDADENVYVLEVNANPCISPDSGFISAAVHAGYSHEDIISHIINDLNK